MAMGVTRAAMRAGWGAAMLVGLVACGGGGGGTADETGGGVPPTGGVRETPLAITQSNARDAAAAAASTAESMLMLGQAAVEWLDELAAAGGGRVDRPCIELGSSMSLVLVDRDGNGRPGPGDRVDVQLRDNCDVAATETWFSGTATIELAAPPATGARWEGQLSFGPSFGNGREDQGQIRIEGGLRFEARSERLAESLRVRSGAQPLTVGFTLSGQRLDEVVTELDATKSVHRDAARARATMQLRLASDTLRGAIRVATPVAFDAWLDTFPDAGTLHIAGEAQTVLSVAATGAESSQFELSLFGGSLGRMPADELVEGLFWNGTGITQPHALFGRYHGLPASQRPFATISAPVVAGVQSQMPTLSWQMSRPVRPAVAAFQARGQSQWGVWTIPARVQIEGALVTVTPQTPLEPGMTYDLQLALSEDGGGSTTVSTALTTRAGVAVTALVRGPIPERGWGDPPVHGRGGERVVEATTAAPADDSLATLRWTQISGPTLQIDDPGAAVAQISVPAAAAGQLPGTAVLEVEVTSAAGVVDRARVQLYAIPDFSLATAIGWRADLSAPYYVRGGPWTPPVDTGYSVKLHNGRLLDSLIGPRLFIQPPEGIVWQTGMVWDIQRGAEDPDTRASLTPDQAYPGSALCLGVGGRVEVFDFGTDTVGRMDRLAVDYRFLCSDGRTIEGWVRMGSPVPPPL